MGFLALAVACSLSIAMIFKHAAARALDRVALLTVNYGAGALLAAALVAGDDAAMARGLAVEPGLIALGVGTGALFIGGFFVYALAIREAGMALASGVMRLAVVLPFLASWVVWGEAPTPGQVAGLAVAGVAFFLIARTPRPAVPAAAGVPATAGVDDGSADVAIADGPGADASGARGLRTLGVLALLFVAGGLGDIAMKTFSEVYGATNSSDLFGLLLFAVAFLIGLALVVRDAVRTGRRPTRAELGWGVLLGAVNYGSVVFIIAAIDALRGPLVFPLNNIAIVLGAAVLGVVVWGERLSRVNLAGLALAVAALALLWA